MLNTLGDHLKRRRLELRQFQKEVSLRLGVNEWTYHNWETNKNVPMVSMYPKIIEFLGYYPFPEPQTLGEHILGYRRRKGLSLKRMAKILDVDEGTLTRWEKGIVPHALAHRRVLDSFFAECELPDSFARRRGISFDGKTKPLGKLKPRR